MTKKFIIFIIFIFVLSASIITACGQKSPENKKIGDVEFQIIDPASLKDNELKSWYEDSYKERFTHSVSYIDGYKYVLICAGKMPTDGYNVSITDVKKENETIVFYAKLISPKPEQKTAQVLTYPHVLFRINEKEEITVRAELDMGGIIGNQGTISEKYIDLQGIYIGLADNNFIEIKLDKNIDLPGDTQPVVFKLTDSIIGYFSKDSTEYKDFKENDSVRFDCTKNKEGQWEINKIEKISDGSKEDSITGEYVGQIDGNSVEIKIEGTPGTFRLDDNLKAFFETNEIEEGTKVAVKYKQEAGMRILTEIKVITN